MLETLKIRNIALIDSLEINFQKGLNVLTGETGAGKSIIIDSLSFLLGARADKTLIRRGENTARVDGVFSVSSDNLNIRHFFDSAGIEFSDSILITRMMNTDGKSDARINGEIVSLNMLKELTAYLVDIYGQQEQVGILKTKNQLKLLDNFIGEQLFPLKQEYFRYMKDLKSTNERIALLGGSPEERAREIDLLSFGIEEIERAKLSIDEEEKLAKEKILFSNMEKILTSTTMCENLLSTAVQEISSGGNALIGAEKYDSSLSDLSKRLISLKIELDDILLTLEDYNSSANYDENRFNEIDSRLDEYKRLKRKYGQTVEEIFEYLHSAKEQLQLLENSENERNNLLKHKDEVLHILYDVAKDITLMRRERGQELSKLLVKNLTELGMPSAKIQFQFNTAEYIDENLLSDGMDTVEIMFNANAGEEIKPLNKVASGGELSRFMLALKAVVADMDDMPTMVFDEIDTGISGKMSQVVSEKIAKISKYHQVLVVTHSAQIAAMADVNFLIEKQEINGKTISSVKLLSSGEKLKEVARFISIDSTLNISIASAQALIEEQGKYKRNL